MSVCSCGCGHRPAKRGAEYVRGHRPVTDLALLFWPKVERSDGCWEWRAAKGHGYGCLFHPSERRLIRAHRASWILHFGEIPEGMFVCHSCDNRGCVRPDHLFLGTHQDNVDDAVAKGRIVRSRARGERSGNTKLTEAQVAEIRRRYVAGSDARHKRGCSSSELAREFGIRRQYVGQLARGEWRRDA